MAEIYYIIYPISQPIQNSFQ